jgi:hypothetical protein
MAISGVINEHEAPVSHMAFASTKPSDVGDSICTDVGSSYEIEFPLMVKDKPSVGLLLKFCLKQRQVLYYVENGVPFFLCCQNIPELRMSQSFPFLL